MASLVLAEASPIAPDPAATRRFYAELLGIPIVEEDDRGDIYFAVGDHPVRLGMWTLQSCADACFASPDWPEDLPIPCFNLEFVATSEADVRLAAQRLERAGVRPVTPLSRGPSGVTSIRALSPEGVLVGITYTPHVA